MISEIPGPICVRLSGIVGGRWVIVLGKTKIKKLNMEVVCLQPNPIWSLHA